MPSLDVVLGSIRYRLRQGVRFIVPALPPERDEILANWLTQDQATAFRALNHGDQAHAIRVFEALQAEPSSSRDLLVAALLHDMAKVDSIGRVRLPHRVVRVLLSKWRPDALAWLSREPAQRWRAGFVLAVHHPRIGAERAEALGCSARTCWLIAHHADKPAPDDAELRRLIVADHNAE